jgi:hypothetical protein
MNGTEKERFAASRTVRGRTLMIVALVFVLGLGTLPGKMRRGVLAGTVTDASGTPLKGASVQLENLVTLRIRSVVTNKEGRYHFSGLRSDIDYTLKANYHGKWSSEEYLSRFDAKPKITKDLQIK